MSLGCEGTDHERMYKELSATGKHVEIIHIQELGGVSKAIQLGTDIARKLVIEISGLQRQPVDVSKIVMAIKCGASDTTSGMASNCVIGYVADKLVDLGATVIFGETTEFLGGEHLLARRAVNKEVADKIYEIVTNMETAPRALAAICARASPHRATSPAVFPVLRKRALVPSSRAAPAPSRACWNTRSMLPTRKACGSRIRRAVSLRF